MLRKLQLLVVVTGMVIAIIPVLHSITSTLINELSNSTYVISASSSIASRYQNLRDSLINSIISDNTIDYSQATVNNLVIAKEVISPYVESRPYSVEMFESAGVMFPEIHFIIFFKETSFCKRVSEGTYSFCSDDINEVLGFYPNNGSGMKHASYRPTTSIGSIGDVIKSRGIVLPNKYKRYYDDPHAVFRSPYDHCVDIALWQNYWMKRKNIYPKTEEEYISFLKKIGYNPYDKYYNHETKGLKSLYRMYKSGSFKNKYNKYLIDRLGYSL